MVKYCAILWVGLGSILVGCGGEVPTRPTGIDARYAGSEVCLPTEDYASLLLYIDALEQDAERD